MKKPTSIKTRITIWYTTLMFVLIVVVLSLVGGLSYQLSIDSVEKDVTVSLSDKREIVNGVEYDITLTGFGVNNVNQVRIEINPKEPRYLKVVWGVGYKVEKI